MVRKMTSLPASRFGLRGRGRVEKGYYADMVVFDPRMVSSGSSFDQPAVYPAGVGAVIVNGQVTVENGEHSGARAGRVLRRAA
jgi:N-acyl-D-amino-acid deacylase